MKKILLISLILLGSVGCHSKLLDHSNDNGDPQIQQSTSSIPQSSGLCPDLGIDTPVGFTRNSYYQALKGSSYDVKITNDSNSTLYVLLKDVGTWFRLGKNVSGAYYYQRPSADTVTYKGPYLDNKETCIYEFIPDTH